MFLDENAFEMEDNPYHPVVNSRSGDVHSRPGTGGGQLDFNKGRYGG